VPLVATFLFSLKSNQTGKCCVADSYTYVIHNGQFWHTLRLSALLALETIVISLALFVPDRLLGSSEGAEAAAGDGLLCADSRSWCRRSCSSSACLNLYKGSPGWFYAKRGASSSRPT